MDLGTLTSNLTPYQRVGVASTPMLLSLLLRLLVGKNRPLQMVLMGSATWLAMNTVLSPYMSLMKENIGLLRDLLGN